MILQRWNKILFPLFCFVIVFFSFFLISCRYLSNFNYQASQTSAHQPSTHFLTELEAKRRAQVLSQVQYQISVQLDRENSFYFGAVELDFNWIKNRSFLRIDFLAGDLQKLVVNSKVLIGHNNDKKRSFQKTEDFRSKKGNRWTDTDMDSSEKGGEGSKLYRYNKRALFLSPVLLNAGKNNVIVHFKKSYSSSRQGFIRFQDPKDKRVYLYTHFQPYGANEFFPCFDQPDIKATYTLKVEAPRTWTVVSSMKEYRIENLGSKTLLWHFPKSFKFSPYLFSLHAGPYHKWESQTSSGMPLRLFSRKSVTKYVHPKIWFDFTRIGLHFFSSYFQHPYPYSKYDHVIVPIFLAGAMENVGAVTFNELFLFKEGLDSYKKFFLALIIFHEISHMWFGNLVTLKWWDDLWLHESFATYMSYVAMKKNTSPPFPFLFLADLSKHKQRIFFQDDSDFTHPVISTGISNTEEALAEFDGITYGKGSLSLKQLALSLGETEFRRILKEYLHRFYENNASWEDFLNTFSELSDFPFRSWNRKWLKTTGFNSIKAVFRCEGKGEDKNERGKIVEFSLHQGVAAGEKVIRPHQLKLVLFQFQGHNKKAIQRIKSLDIKLEKEKLFLPELKGLPCPDLVYPNFELRSYIQVHLDSRTIKNVLSHLEKISSPSLRLLLLSDIWMSVERGDFSLLSYSDLFLKQLRREKKLPILKNLLRNLSSIYYYYPKRTKEEKQRFLSFAAKLEVIIWDRMKLARLKEERLLWKKFFVQAAWTPFALHRLYGLLNGTLRIRGLSFKQSHERWPVIQKLSEFQFKDIEKILDKEHQKDSSFEGRQGFLSASALKPALENKNFWLKKILLDESSSIKNFEKAVVFRHLYPLSQNHLRKHYKSFFEDLIKMSRKHKSLSFFLPFIDLAPSDCDKSVKRRIDKFVKKQVKGLQKIYRKGLHFQSQKIAKCLRVRQASF